MKLEKLLKIADSGYPDTGMIKQASEIGEACGDTLAVFVVRELRDTFEPKSINALQLQRARRVVRTAINDLTCVHTAIDEAMQKARDRKPKKPAEQAPIDWAALHAKLKSGEAQLLDDILTRAKEDYSTLDSLSLSMDLLLYHTTIQPLDLDKLLNAPLADFGHDIAGIRNGLDRTTGTMRPEERCFIPRCAAKKGEKIGVDSTSATMKQ
ncbi:MAG: hypothetical protein WC107_07475 [Patescibacteria group bacterium]